MKYSWLLLVGLVLSLSANGVSQTPSSLTIVASKTSFIFGEPIKLTVRVRDNAGKEILQPTLGWVVDPPAAATVSSDGTVTPLQLQTVVFKAQAGTAQGEIAIQILPKSIVVTPQRDTMTVGSTQVIQAEAMDIANRPIPGVSFRWNLSNLLRGWDTNNPMASVDGAGQMLALVQGKVLIAATIEYSTFLPTLLNQARGEAIVEMRAVKTYEFGRVFAAEPKNGASLLVPRSAHLMPTENDGFMFGASLDGTGLSLVRWQNGTVQALLSEGRNHIQTGQPLIDILAYATNHNTEMLTGEVDTTGNTQVSWGPAEVQTPLLVPGTPLYIADRTTRFEVQRNSLSDSGINLVQAYYNEVDTLRPAIGLFRGNGKGLSEKIVSTLEKLPGFPSDPFSFRYYGVTSDGTAWFSTNIGIDGSKYALWKQKPFGSVERILGDNDAFQGSTIRGVTNSGSAAGPGLFVASNGEVVASVQAANANYYVRWMTDDSPPQVLKTGTSGLYWHEPGIGTLINSNVNNRGSGLYLWTQSETRPLLIIGTPLNGSPVTEIQSAVSNSRGVIFAMVSTVNDPMLIVRLQPDVQVLLRSGDAIPVSVAPVVSAIVKGFRNGLPVVIAGGQTATIAEVGANKTLVPLVSLGDALPGGKTFRGSNAAQVRTLANGDILFADSNALYSWKNGSIVQILQNPTTVAGAQIGSPSAIDVNSRGDVAGQFFFGTGTGIYLLSNGAVTKILRIGETLNNEVVTAVRQPAIDDTGQIAFYAVTERSEYLTLWKAGTLTTILSDGATLPDGRVVKSHDNTILSANDGFVLSVNLTDGQRTLLRYRNAFEFVVKRDVRSPNGSYVLYTSTWAANRSSGVAFFYNGGAYINHLVAKRGDSLYEIQDWAEMTSDQDLLVSVTSLYMSDDGTVFSLATDDTGQQLIYRGAPIAGSIEVPFTARSFGGLSMTTTGSPSSISIGYARLDSRSQLPALAIFGYRQNGVLVSEAAVPASQPTTSGRIYAEIGGPVNTGVAIANPNEQTATINYSFTRTDGSEFKTGSLTMAAGQQTAAFLNQAPFNSGNEFTGTFSFTSSAAISVIALRGYTNARGEFLITTLPVVNLSQTASTTVAIIPHFATGGGWTTQILLVNPTGTVLTGTVMFYSSGSGTSPGLPVSVTVGGQFNSSFSYSIQPKASLKLVLSGTASATTTGSVRVTPSPGNVTPSSLAVFSFTSGNTVVSEAGAAGTTGDALQMYAESSGTPFAAGSVQTGIAIANSSNQAVSVTLELRRLDGTSAGVGPSTVSIPPNGQVGKFLNEFFPALNTSFQGILRMTAAAPVSVVGLRGRTNERNDFLITTTSPSPIVNSTASSNLILPHLVDGGGYTTQIIVVGNGAGDFSGTLQFFGQSGLPLPLVFR